MNENRVMGEKCQPLKGENNLNESGGPAGHLKSLKARTASLAVLQEQKRIR